MSSNHIVVRGLIGAEDGGFVAYCPELDVTSQGDTLEEAAKNLREALELHVSCLIENNELERELAERGLPVYSAVPANLPVSGEIPPGTFLAMIATRVPDLVHA